MKRSIKSFSTFNITTQEAHNIKGGGIPFCEWYISYTQNNNFRIDPAVMSVAMGLDQIVNSQGMSAAMKAGGDDFMSTYSF